MKQDHVLITGASSGIGEALARHFARPGVALVLVSRDSERLDAVGAACRTRGARVETHALDVTDEDGMASLFDGRAPLDLVIASAGVAYGAPPDGVEPARQIRHTFAVNVGGVLNTVLPAIDAMLARPRGTDGLRGRIVVISSVAAFIAYPNSPTYCASKSAIDVWTVATAANLAKSGVVLTSVCPGFVRTPMTAPNDFPMPGLLGIEEAVQRIVAGIEGGGRRVVFPGWIGAGSRFVGMLPTALREAILRRQPSKAPQPMAPAGADAAPPIGPIPELPARPGAASRGAPICCPDGLASGGAHIAAPAAAGQA